MTENTEKSKKVKRVIAREGLIVLSLFVVSVILVEMPSIYLSIENFFQGIKGKHGRFLEAPAYINSMADFGFTALFSGYPFYWLIRFVIWAIKILRKK